MGRKLSKYLKSQFRYRKTKRTNSQGTISLIKSVYHRSARFLITVMKPVASENIRTRKQRGNNH